MKNLIFIVTATLLAIGCNSNQPSADYTKPLEEYVETYMNDSLEGTTHSFYTYDGDSLSRVEYYENNDSLNKTIYEFVWENKHTKCIYITEGNEREKVKEEKYNDRGQLLERTVFRTFHYNFDVYSLAFWQEVFTSELKSKLVYTYNDQGLCVEKYYNFQPGWGNIEKYTYNGKIKTTLFERYRDSIRIDTSSLFFRGKEEVYYDDNFKKLKSTKDLHKDPKKDTSWEEYDYYPNDSIKTRYSYEDGKLVYTSKYKYDDQWRLLSGDGTTYDYKNFTKEVLGIKVKYLDDKFDKIVYYNIMGMVQKCSYDEYKRPLEESIENGTTTSPDFDAKYTYDGNVTTILRHERGFFDKKGEKSVTKKIRVVYKPKE